MTKTELAKQIASVFDTVYPDAKCSLDYTTEHELLVATMLSAQCTDARVNLVTPALFNRYKSVEDFANADVGEVEEYIHSCGFYRNKAKNIVESAKQIIARHNGRVPDTMEEMTSLAGVGRKTANLILGDVFSKPSIVVDTHCIRLSNRLGLATGDDPVKVEMQLKKVLDPNTSTRFCHQIVYHGRQVCTAKKPKCTICPVRHLCKEGKKEQL